MRVVRIKYKAGLTLFVLAFLALLYVLSSNHSNQEVQIYPSDIVEKPTSTVDFVNIAKNVGLETGDKDKRQQERLKNVPLARGNLKNSYQKLWPPSTK